MYLEMVFVLGMLFHIYKQKLLLPSLAYVIMCKNAELGKSKKCKKICSGLF